MSSRNLGRLSERASLVYLNVRDPFLSWHRSVFYLFIANNKDVLYDIAFLKCEYTRIMARIAKRVTLTDKQRDILNQIATSRTQRQDHIERAKIILLSSNARQDKQIKSELDAHEAISREKKIKRWRRQWKINLIEQNNPHWTNLAIGLF